MDDYCALVGVFLVCVIEITRGQGIITTQVEDICSYHTAFKPVPQVTFGVNQETDWALEEACSCLVTPEKDDIGNVTLNVTFTMRPKSDGVSVDVTPCSLWYFVTSTSENIEDFFICSEEKDGKVGHSVTTSFTVHTSKTLNFLLHQELMVPDLWNTVHIEEYGGNLAVACQRSEPPTVDSCPCGNIELSEKNEILIICLVLALLIIFMVIVIVLVLTRKCTRPIVPCSSMCCQCQCPTTGSDKHHGFVMLSTMPVDS